VSFEANTNARLAALEENNRQLAGRVRLLEKMLDTKNAWWFKRLWWRLDGFGPWYQVTPKRSRRPWH
jgi:hypothetical protein